MAKPITPTPPITGKAAAAFNAKSDRISRGEITVAERRAADERFERIFRSYRPSTNTKRLNAK